MRAETVISFLMALCIVGGAIWLLDRYALKKHESPPAQKPASIAVPRTPGPPPRPVEPAQEVPAAARQSAAPIRKCVIDGRTVYSDADCKDNASAREVVLRDSRGYDTKIVRVPESEARDRQARRQREVEDQAREEQRRVAFAEEARRKFQCASLEDLIRALDAEARQPLQAIRQDQIRVERKAANDQMYSLRCGR